MKRYKWLVLSSIILVQIFFPLLSKANTPGISQVFLRYLSSSGRSETLDEQCTLRDTLLFSDKITVKYETIYIKDTFSLGVGTIDFVNGQVSGIQSSVFPDLNMLTTLNTSYDIRSLGDGVYNVLQQSVQVILQAGNNQIVWKIELAVDCKNDRFYVSFVNEEKQITIVSNRKNENPGENIEFGEEDKDNGEGKNNEENQEEDNKQNENDNKEDGNNDDEENNNSEEKLSKQEQLLKNCPFLNKVAEGTFSLDYKTAWHLNTFASDTPLTSGTLIFENGQLVDIDDSCPELKVISSNIEYDPVLADDESTLVTGIRGDFLLSDCDGNIHSVTLNSLYVDCDGNFEVEFLVSKGIQTVVNDKVPSETADTGTAQECELMLSLLGGSFSIQYALTGDSPGDTSTGTFTFRDWQLVGRSYSNCPSGMTIVHSDIDFTPIKSSIFPGKINGYLFSGLYGVTCNDKTYAYHVSFVADCNGNVYTGQHEALYEGGKNTEVLGVVEDKNEDVPVIHEFDKQVSFLDSANTTGVTKDAHIPPGILVTQTESRATFTDPQNTEVTMKNNTVLGVEKNSDGNSNHYNLHQGSAYLRVAQNTSDSLLSGPFGKISVVDTQSRNLQSGKRVDNSPLASFMTAVSQTDTQTQIDLQVYLGQVKITNNKGLSQLVSAGETFSLQQPISRSNIVLPVNNGYLYTEKNNFLAWTAYPGADTYVLEFTLPGSFSSDNVSAYEFEQQLVRFNAENLTHYGNILVTPAIFFTRDLRNQKLDIRIFAADAEGNILPNSVSSDTVHLEFR